MKPYEKRTPCKFCGTKGYLKIIKNEDTNNQIRKALIREVERKCGVMYCFELDPPLVRCYCQECGNYGNYRVEEGLFSDGVVKEI